MASNFVDVSQPLSCLAGGKHVSVGEFQQCMPMPGIEPWNGLEPWGPKGNTPPSLPTNM